MSIDYHIVDALRDARTLFLDVGRMCSGISSFLSSHGELNAFLRAARIRLNQENEKRTAELVAQQAALRDAMAEAEAEREMDELADRDFKTR